MYRKPTIKKQIIIGMLRDKEIINILRALRMGYEPICRCCLPWSQEGIWHSWPPSVPYKADLFQFFGSFNTLVQLIEQKTVCFGQRCQIPLPCQPCWGFTRFHSWTVTFFHCTLMTFLMYYLSWMCKCMPMMRSSLYTGKTLKWSHLVSLMLWTRFNTGWTTFACS